VQPALVDEGLRIQLEGSLELVEGLVQAWERASAELQQHDLPRPETLAAVRLAETQSEEAVERAQRREETREVFAALERARASWAETVRARLASFGLPTTGTSPRELLHEVAERGTIEVLADFVDVPRRPLFPSAPLGALWGVTLLANAVLALVPARLPALSLLDAVWVLVLLCFTLMLLAVRLLLRPAHREHPALNGLTLFARDLPPIELPRVTSVTWPGATLDPTELEFHLDDGSTVTRVFSPNADSFVARLRALGVQVSP
jgi:hypothetical protein